VETPFPLLLLLLLKVTNRAMCAATDALAIDIPAKDYERTTYPTSFFAAGALVRLLRLGQGSR